MTIWAFRTTPESFTHIRDAAANLAAAGIDMGKAWDLVLTGFVGDQFNRNDRADPLTAPPEPGTLAVVKRGDRYALEHARESNEVYILGVIDMADPPEHRPAVENQEEADG